MTGATMALVAGMVFGTSFLAGIFGMAGGMILMGGLLSLMPLATAMVLHAIAQMASNGARALLWRRKVNWTIVARYVVGLVAASGLFASVRFVPHPAAVLITLGLIPLGGMLIPTRWAPRADRRYGSEVCGFLGTSIQLISGVSGPTLDLFFVRTPMDRREVVATKATCQTITHLTKFLYFTSVGGLTAAPIDLALVGLVIVLAIVATSLSRLVLERLSNVQFRLWSRWLLTVVALVFLLQGVWKLLDTGR